MASSTHGEEEINKDKGSSRVVTKKAETSEKESIELISNKDKITHKLDSNKPPEQDVVVDELEESKEEVKGHELFDRRVSTLDPFLLKVKTDEGMKENIITEIFNDSDSDINDQTKKDESLENTLSTPATPVP